MLSERIVANFRELIARLSWHSACRKGGMMAKPVDPIERRVRHRTRAISLARPTLAEVDAPAALVRVFAKPAPVNYEFVGLLGQAWSQIDRAGAISWPETGECAARESQPLGRAGMTADTKPNSPPDDSAPPPGENPANRRERVRQPYRMLQWVAPCPVTGLPDPSSFQQVHCQDISRSGIAYRSQIPPLDKFVVFALRNGARTTYLKARVANCARVVEATHGYYRVGCEFIDRVQLEDK